MENKRNKKDIVLLPNYFKIIGLVVMILAIVPAVVVISMNIQLLQEHKELFKEYTSNAFILGLFFVAWSRDKVEDEMTFSIRLKSMAFAFVSAVFYLIISPFVDFLFKNPIKDESGHQVVVSMLFFYLIMYYLQKRGR